MSRYIDADHAEFRLQCCGTYHGVIAFDTVKAVLNDAPSIDIVFCRECHWSRPRSLPGETGYRCVLHRIWKGENGFCDSGDRKEGE